MTRLPILLFFGLFSVGCVAPAVTGPDQTPDGNPAQPPVESLQAFVDTALSDSGAPAIGAVVVRDGRIWDVAVSGVRRADGSDTVLESDYWHIGSLTKAMTSTLIGVYVERGILQWKTRAIDVWPEIEDQIHPAYRQVTLLDLLSHTAGVAKDVMSIPSRNEVLDGALQIQEQRKRWSHALLRLPPESAAGEYHYSNGGYIIAGAMLETAVGASWESLIRLDLFSPLAMTSSGFGPPPEGQLEGHRVVNGQLSPTRLDNPQALGPAGTVHTTLADYATFMLLHLNDRNYPLLQDRTLRILHRPRSNSGMALGWVSQRPSGRRGRTLSHAGSNRFWWAQVRLLPDHEIGILLVVNSGEPGTQRAVRRLEERLVDWLLEDSHGP